MSSNTDVHTAVVFVHGLLERRPTDILDAFAKSVLTPHHGRWEYYPQPIEVTDSYEARRYSAPSAGVDLFEYDWSFLATSTRYAGFAPALLRVLLRRPRHVPDQIFGIWRAAWLTLLIPASVLITLFIVGGYLLHTGIPGWILGVVSSVVVLSIAVAVFRMLPRALTRSFLTTGFVSVARYFDLQPESLAARRATRGGLVDLLHTLHQGSYARVVVVGHGVGGFIAYDALTTLWAEMHELHADSASGLSALAPVEAAAGGEIGEFQDAQLRLWQDLRSQGNPWRVTDFVTIGTPMAFADLFVSRPPILAGLGRVDARQGNPWRVTDFVTIGTPMAFADLFVSRPPILAGLGRVDARHALFDRLSRRGVVLRCPPRSEALTVDSDEDGPVSYGCGPVLGAQSLFAVTRWTNLWFPVARGSVSGDWFGGLLAPLFGAGVRDIAVTGNLPERRRPGAAQTQYFTHPEHDAHGDVAWHLRAVLALDRGDLQASLDAPEADPATVRRVVYRSWQRSM
ncbi:hypothetical protein [Mycobacterium sp. M26]|uniref:hypothetical protein n=1 Tax=Mycobacterium sp. M26 TaxID=1762962 RepID=UPI00073E18F7|nr:hypothetical protein [Mycobacterium sp. M26]